MSDATRKEIFGATAAFVAVQVVFVGAVVSNSSGSNADGSGGGSNSTLATSA
jgi:hypothetical protein